MSPVDRHQRMTDLFHRALECPAEQREGFLRGECEGDRSLADEVLTLLAAEAGGTVDAGPAVAAAAATAVAQLGEGPGSRIGPYKLLEQIGEGGFGVVFMAEQETPVVRRVALKIIKLGMDTRQVIARFEAERQALAMMDHPNIARVLDAGATETGRPYFVMELVRGDPITDYCDRNSLSTQERLDLFTQVCHAVQHAHQKGIIHRDIKPSNVLVTMFDGRPVPKVIDFGIAKAMHHRLTEKTLFTQHRHLIGTPAYMSPEQAEMTGVDIDTRSDLYSLGVLLYELLTGTTPFEPERLRSAAYGELQRIIREEEPPKPSTRISTLRDGLANVAAHRRTEPGRLHALIRGDLDWIVMKCLEKDRTRRYETADGLALDVLRHLAGEPVVAAPPSQVYRVRKFIGRHRGSVAVAAAIGGVLILGLVGTSAGFLSAERQRRQADEARKAALTARDTAEAAKKRSEAIRLFMQNALQAGDPYLGGDQDLRVVDAMNRAAAELDAGRFKDDPEREAQMRLGIAEILQHNSRVNEALPQAERSLRLFKEVHPGDHEDVANALRGAGSCLMDSNRVAEALERFDAALAMDRRLFGDEDRRVGFDISYCGNALMKLGRYSEALPKVREVLELDQRLDKGDSSDVAIDLRTLADCYRMLGRLDEALMNARASLAMLRRIKSGDDPDLASSMFQEGACLQGLGRYGDALAVFEPALKMRQRIFKHDNHSIVMALYAVAECLQRLDRSEDALEHHQTALAMARRLGDPDEISGCLIRVGYSLRALNRSAEALPLLAEALEMTQRVWKGDHPAVAGAQTHLGRCLVDLNRNEEALGHLEAALAMRRRLYMGEDHPDIADGLDNLSDCLEALGRNADAVSKLDESVNMYRRLYGGDHPYVALLLHKMGNIVYYNQHDPVAAERPYREAVDMQRRLHPNDPALVLGVKASLAVCLEEEVWQARSDSTKKAALSEKAREAEEIARECVRIRTNTIPDDWRLFSAKSVLGAALVVGVALQPASERLNEAESLLTEGYEGVTARRAHMNAEERELVLPAPARRLARLYTLWNEVEPGGGFATKAASWQKKCDDLVASK